MDCLINSIKRKLQLVGFIYKNPFQKRKYRKWFPPSENSIKKGFWVNVGHGVRIDLGLCYTKDIKKIQKVGLGSDGAHKGFDLVHTLFF